MNLEARSTCAALLQYGRLFLLSLVVATVGAGPAAAGTGVAGTRGKMAMASQSAALDPPDIAAGEVLLKLASSDLLPDLLVKHQLSLVSRLGARPIFRLKVAGAATVADKTAALALEPGVLLAEPNRLHGSPEAAKNYVWAIGTEQAAVEQWAFKAMRLPQALEHAVGAGVRVAVLDTGVDASHPLLAERLLPGWDFVGQDADPSEEGSRADLSYGHGTHVAGLVAMAAPGARIMPLRVLDRNGSGDAWTLLAALLHAVDPDGNPATDDGAQVINLSLASPVRTRLFDTLALLASCTPPDPTIPEDSLADAGYDGDRSRCNAFGGAVVVVAAGNDGSGSLKTYPAAEGAYGLIAVAASASNGRLAGFSNSGKWIQIAAPGDGVTSSVPGGWGTWGGTSMAAPLVAGTVALMRSLAPALTAKDAVRCVARSGRVLQGTALTQVDSEAALKAIGPRQTCR